MATNNLDKSVGQLGNSLMKTSQVTSGASVNTTNATENATNNTNNANANNANANNANANNANTNNANANANANGTNNANANATNTTNNATSNNEAQGGGALNSLLSSVGTAPGMMTDGSVMPDTSAATALTGVMESLTELTGKVTAMNESVGGISTKLTDAEKSMIASVNKSLQGGLPKIVTAAKIAAENAVNGISSNMSGDPGKNYSDPGTNGAALIGGRGRKTTPKKRRGSKKGKRRSVKSR
jgi:hypothetical protein